MEPQAFTKGELKWLAGRGLEGYAALLWVRLPRQLSLHPVM
jgi:hypothetical protein